jgi:N-acetylglucosamine-6-sulfatase
MAVRFEKAYVTVPLYCPERASFLSGGWRRSQTDVLRNHDPDQGGAPAFPDERSIAVRLQEVGIRTALIGKYLNGYDALLPRVPPGWSTWEAQTESPWTGFHYFEGRSTAAAPGVATTRHWAGYIAEWYDARSLEFLNQPQEDAIFLYLSYLALHDPHEPAPQDQGAYAGLTYRDRAFDEEDVSDKPSWVQAEPRIDDADLAELDRAVQERNESLLAVDRSMAAVIDAVHASGRLDRTLFILTSDNGQQWGEHRLFTKGVGYEESVHVPLWIANPAITPRAESGLVAANLDLTATVQDLAGLTIEGEGQSLRPVLCGEAAPTRDAILIENWNQGRPWAGLVTDRWKFIQTGVETVELYDLLADPFELESLHADPTLADQLAEFQARTEAERGLAILDPEQASGCGGPPYKHQFTTAGGTPPIHFQALEGLPEGLELSEDGLLLRQPPARGGLHAAHRGQR